MQIECPSCRRVLVYNGDRPSFCAYCGVRFAGQGVAVADLAGSSEDVRPAAIAPNPRAEPPTDPDSTRAQPAGFVGETVVFEGSSPHPGGPTEAFPEQIASYRLIRKLGSGGMGTVFEAEDEAQGQRVAIKVIGGDYLDQSEAVNRFRQEGRLASAVTHPRCVFVRAVDEFQGRPYIVMELMPGTTLQTLVEQGGPLDSSAAILKILDVIEGLQEFHKRGLIHRDVKPSNCFLDDEGRVKIGDFGLSKSLEGGAGLTRSGTFLGTPLYASPEQIKRDEVDQRTDVYSVAATIYYLLSGRPPVRAEDATEALARIVSEPAPALRGLRPELPRALEAVIHRGLERDPSRRWRNLQELHDALLPFVPERLSIARIGRRVGAYLVDLGLWYLVSYAIFGIVLLYHNMEYYPSNRVYIEYARLIGWWERVLWIAYYAVVEGLWGASLGKWMFHLRVCRTDRGGPPGIGRGLARSSIFYSLTELPADLYAEFAAQPQELRMLPAYLMYELAIRACGPVALLSTMRQGSGLRGPHEWLSATRVVGAVRRSRPRPTHRFRAIAGSRSSAGGPVAADVPATVGPYAIREVVESNGRRSVMVGQDSTLGRDVWVVRREPGDPTIPVSRRALSRRGRLRWIGCGEDRSGRWDAFTAPAGVPLEEMVSDEGLPWRDVLTLLRELADDLRMDCDEGTLPGTLSPRQVWIGPDGAAQLVEFLDDPGSDRAGQGGAAPAATPAGPRSPEGGGPPHPSPEERRAMSFLGEVARTALEGVRPRGLPRFLHNPNGSWSVRRRLARRAETSGLTPQAGRQRIRAAVPERARLLLDRLTGVRAPFHSLDEVRAELEQAASRPTEVGVARRAVHLAIQGFFLSPGLAVMLLISSGILGPGLFPGDAALMVLIPMLWVLWSAVSPGGFSAALAGLCLVRGDGRPAGRRACILRSLLIWAAPAALLAASCYVRDVSPRSLGLALALWLAALVILLAFVALALIFPARSIQDRLAGTILVPA
ncbi:Serine/threonine-protein kinase PrkC [Aquisphaera giovannonii]|uniref:Serine/threonine-protein kinase PrkC n=1 Tax=Aquisphaera giovannonii TaxID=406548 RepID=A0A5B9W9E6_9BACT|nr:protein kinase [Aquisphaera giovannonii]QEH36705.1 Serine/threonine-protein kinase PrkC [Aquisphaera giovannonii]